MNFKRGLMVFCLIICILFCVSSVSAADANDTAIATDDNINDDALAIGAIDDNKVNTDNENQIESTDNNATYLTSTEEPAASNLGLTINVISDENVTINAKILPINTEGEYKAGRATFKVVGIDDNVPLSNISVGLMILEDSNVIVNGAMTDENGIATFNFEDLHYCSEIDGNISYTIPPAGKYVVKLMVFGGNCHAQDIPTSLTINKATLKITVTNVTDYYGTNKKFTIKVTNAATGLPLRNETFRTYFKDDPDEYYYSTTDSNGIMAFYVDTMLPGTYETVTSPNKTSNINGISAKGKITIKGKGKIALSQSGTATKTLTVKVKITSPSLTYFTREVKLTFSNGKKVTVRTNFNGVAKYKMDFKSGTYWVKATIADSDYTFNSPKLTNIKIGKQSVTINPKKLVTAYKSGEYFQAKVVDSKTKEAVKGVPITMNVYTGKKAKTVSLKSNANGIVKYSASKLSIGTHKVVLKVKASKMFAGKSATSSIKVGKQTVIIKPVKLSTTYKSGKLFYATVINSKTKKPVKGVAIILKVGNGKAITLKTNAYGIVKYSSSNLKVGTYKVVLKVKANKYFTGKTKTSSITIAGKKSSSNSNTPTSKLETHFEIVRWNINRAANGGLQGVTLTLNLVDEHGNILHEKITGQIRMGNIIDNEPYGDEVTGVSGSPLKMTKMVGGYYLFAKVTFKGNSKYKAAFYTYELPSS